MASSGSASVSVTSYDTLKISWSVNSQSTSNNTSSVTFTAQLVANSSGGKISSTASKSYTATIDGTQYSGTNTVGISAGATKTLFSKTVTISHNSDGSKSFTFSFKQEFSITFSGSWISTKTASCTVTLNTIARASSISSVSGVTLGNSCSVTWTPASSSFGYKLKFVLGSQSKTTSMISPNRTSSYTYTGYTMSLSDWAPYITTAMSGTCTVTLYTYSSTSSSSSIGSSSKTFKLTVPSSVKPTVAINSISEGAGISGGQYIQNVSKPVVKFVGTSAYSSPLSSYTVSVGSNSSTGSSITSGTEKSVMSAVITSSGTIAVTVTIKDGRGQSESASDSISVISYSVPKISQFDVYRSDSNGNQSTEGTAITIEYEYSCSSVNSTNSASMDISWKMVGDSEYSNSVKTGTGLSGNGKIIVSSTTFQLDDGYDFRITVTDNYSTSTKTETITTARYPLSVCASGNGIAFGKIATEEDLMDVNYAARFLEHVDIEKTFSSSGEWFMDLVNTGDLGDSLIQFTSFSGYRVRFGIGSGGINRGVYDATLGHWIVYAGEDGRVHLGTPNSTFVPYYTAGNSSTYMIYTAGFCTSGGSSVGFTIPINRMITDYNTIAVSVELVIRQNGNYCYGSDSSGTSVKPSSITTTYNLSGIRVTAEMSNTTNVTNNDTLGIRADVTLTVT